MNRHSVTCGRLLAALAYNLIALQALAQPTIGTIAVTGQHAFDLPTDAIFSAFDSIGTDSLNSKGQVAFRGWLKQTSTIGLGNQTGIWMGKPGAIHLVARGGDPAPGMGPGVNFYDVAGQHINDAGQIIFAGNTPGVTAPIWGIWRGEPGNLSLVARTGDPAPGTSDGVTFTSLGVVDFNAQGKAVVSGALAGPGVTSSNDEGLWLLDGNSMTLIARDGDQAPGAPGGVKYVIDQGFMFDSSRPVLDNAGRVAFVATLTGQGVSTANNVGLWLSESGTTTLVARQGDPAPGAPPGLVYSLHPTDSNAYPQPVLNDLGSLAFQASVAGPGVSGLNDHTIWMGTPENLAIAVRDGQTDPATGQRFARVGVPRLNDAGQFAFIGAGDSLGIWLVTDDGARLIARQGQIAPESGGRVFAAGMQGVLFAGSLAINSTGQVAFYSTVEPAGSGALGDGLWIDDGAHQARIVTSGDTLAGRTVTFASSGVGMPAVLPFNDEGQLAFNVRFADGGTGLFLYDPSPVPEPSGLTMAAVALAAFVGRLPGAARGLRSCRQ